MRLPRYLRIPTVERAASAVPAMDDLRGVAIFSVLIFHTFRGYFDLPTLTAIVAEIGVPLFFAVSGFCISSGAFARASRGQKVSARHFAQRRIFRIYPPYLIAAAIFLVKVLTVQWQTDALPTLGEVGRMIFFNATLSQAAMDDLPPINPAYWSLCVEFQFYLVFGVLLYLYDTGGRRALAAGIAAVVIVDLALFALLHQGVLQPRGEKDFEILFPHYAPLFALGAAVAWRRSAGPATRRTALVALLLALLLACSLVKMGWLIAALLLPAGLIRTYPRFLVATRLGYFGERSYSIYLMHSLGLATMNRFGTSLYARHRLAGLAALIGTWVVMLAVSWVYFMLVERRFLRSASVESAGPAAPEPLSTG